MHRGSLVMVCRGSGDGGRGRGRSCSAEAIELGAVVFFDLKAE
jgi:hypothetical protein